MIFVLDGPDGTGKTTLAKQICAQTGATYLHLTYRWKDKIHLYHTAALRYAAKTVARTKLPVVIDRWWPSEQIYAKAYRGGSSWPLYGRMAERVARKFGLIYVYCLPDSVEQARSKHEWLKNERAEMYDDIGEVARLYLDLYDGNANHEDLGQYIDQLITNGGVKRYYNVVRYKISEWGHALPIFVDRLVDHATEWRAAQYQPALVYNEWNILGHLRDARYLFVGEQVNPKHRELFWPFFEYGNSSLYLTEALHAINFDESWGMWCNALDHTGEANVHIRELIMQKDMRVITFGNKARDICDGVGVPIYQEVPHPSYAKRFKKVDLVEIFKHAISDTRMARSTGKGSDDWLDRRPTRY